jgi:HAE1 family hydrophobic/amphiphilic exporter-1
MNLSEIFIRRPVATTLVMLSVLFFGIMAYLRLPVSDLPSVEYPAITVSVSYPGANPDTIADNVVSPLERQFLTIDGLQTIVSQSTTGSGTIVLQFDLNKSIDSAAIDVQTAITEAAPQLPADLPYSPTYSKSNPATTPILYFALSSSTMPLHDMYSFANTIIGERLSTVSGVAQVTTYGAPYAVRIRVNPQKIAAKSIGIDEVATAIQNQNIQIPTGTLYGDKREYTIAVDGQLLTASLYDNIIIKNDNGAIVRVRDIGYALDSLSNDKQYTRFQTPDSDTNCIVIAVQTQPGTNTMSVIKAIYGILPELESALPGSVKLNTLFDKSEFIKEAVDDVEFTLLIAFGLVVFVIFIYLGKALDTLIPALALPMSIMGTFVVMSALGYSVDILSLMAITLSIGFLVDDAIVVLENIVRHVEEGKSPLQAALDGSKQISFTIISMTLSLSSVFIPLLFMGGIIGRLFHEFAVVIVCAMLISGFVSLSLTPMLCSRFVPPRNGLASPSMVERFSKRLNQTLLSSYEKALKVILHHPKTTLAVGIFSVILSVTTFKLLSTDFLPPSDIGFVVVHSQATDGTSPFQMIRYQEKLSNLARKNPYIESIVSLGSIPDDNKGIMFIRLKPYKERPPIEQIIHSMHTDMAQVPGLQVFLKSLPLIDLQVSTTDISAPYQYTLKSIDSEALYKSAEIMLEKIKNAPQFTSVSTDLELQQPQLNVRILRDKASVLNVSAQNIENALSLAFAGTNLSPINYPDNEYYAIMEVEPKFYRDPAILSQLYLRSSTGKLVPLNSVTEMSEGVGPLNINRINGLPAVNIFFNTNKIPLGNAIQKLDELARNNLPASVNGQVQGTADVFRASFANLNTLLLVTFFLVYIILGILYENFFHPITVMSTLPPATLGGLLTLVLFNQPLSLYAFVGLILLLGIVMKNGIILVDFANESVIAGKTPEEAITHACLARFRPIVMTTFSALMSAIPIAVGMGGMTAQGREPLGLVIIGGLIISQILTLFLTPVIYLYLETLREKYFHKPPPETIEL